MKELSKFKILNYMDKITELIKSKDTTPVTVEVDPINICNHNCIWCADNKIRRSEDKLDIEFFRILCLQLYEMGIRSILFKGGGEPTLHPDLNKFIESAKEYFKVALLTNGSNLSSELINIIVGNCEYVRISLDAVDEKSHNNWHCPNKLGDWNKIIKGIGRLVKIKKETKSKIKIGINVLYDNLTFRTIPDAVKLAEELGIDILSFRRAYIIEYGFEEDPWLSSELLHCKNIINKIKIKKHNIHIIWDASRGEEINKDTAEQNLSQCLATPLFSIVCADRKVYPCCDLRMIEEYCYGDLTKNTFKEVWESEQRKKILTKKVIPKHCFKHCTHRFTYFNEMLNYLIDSDKPHKELL